MKNRKFNKLKGIMFAVIAVLTCVLLCSCNTEPEQGNEEPEVPAVKVEFVTYDADYEFNVPKGCSTYYYDRLSEQQQDLYRMICKEAESILYDDAQKETLGRYRYADYGLTQDEAFIVRYAFYQDLPLFYIISNGITYNDNNFTIKIAPEFVDKDFRMEISQNIENSVNIVEKLLQGVTEPIYRFKTIYDYVMSNAEYTKDEAGNGVLNGYTYSIVGCLDGNAETGAICQGYAKSLMYLCNYFDIENIYISSDNSRHALNIVNIDGEWYYADATSDDKNEYYEWFLCGDDATWRYLCKPTGDVTNDFLLSVIPELSQKGIAFFDNENNIGYKLGRKGYAVATCKSKAADLVIPEKFNGLNVTGILKDSFVSCYGLSTISIPEYCMDIANGVFDRCHYLRYNIYDNAKYLGNKDDPYLILMEATEDSIRNCVVHDDTKKIYRCAFWECTELISINISDNVTDIGERAFEGCDNLERIDVATGNVKYRSDGNCVIDVENKSVIVGCKNSCIPTDGSVVRIGIGAFYGIKSLTSITIPKNIVAIDAAAFAMCNNLSEIVYTGTVEQWGMIEKGVNLSLGTGEFVIRCSDGDLAKADL